MKVKAPEVAFLEDPSTSGILRQGGQDLHWVTMPTRIILGQQWGRIQSQWNVLGLTRALHSALPQRDWL